MITRNMGGARPAPQKPVFEKVLLWAASRVALGRRIGRRTAWGARGWLSAAAALLLLPAASLAAASEPVLIVLRPQARVHRELVRIGDVTELSGGSEPLRRRIAELDIAKAGAGPLEITRWQLRIRLTLADIPPNAFRLAGSERATVLADRAEIGAPDIVGAIQTRLAKQFGVKAADVEVRPLAKVEPITLTGVPPEQVRLEVVLPLRSPLGTIRTQVLVYAGKEVRRTITLPVDAAVYLHVARARTRIARGQAFTEENIAIERQRVRSRYGIVTAADVIGRYARRTVPAGEVISEYDLDDTGSVEKPVLIRPRDVVRLVAKKGNLIVVVQAAEALQEGREGDIIRVRNPRSRKILTGRVVSDSEVRITF